MKFGIFLYFMMISTSHPFVYLLLLMGACLSVSISLGSLNYASWVSLILVLVILGGLLILFVYMVSVSSFVMVSFNFKLLLFLFIVWLLVATSVGKEVSFLFDYKSVFQLYSSFLSIWTSALVIYLFYCLLVVMEQLSSFKSPLRLCF